MFKKIMPLLVLAFLTMLPASHASTEIKTNLRTFYMNRSFSGESETREALTQAIRFDVDHEVVASFNIGASLFANAELMSDGDAHLTGLLDPEDGDGYAKVGQIYAGYNYKDMFTIRGGRWVMDTSLLSDSDSRATPSSTQALQVTAKYSNYEIYGVYSDRASAKTNDDFPKYEDDNGDEYDLLIAGGDVSFENGLSFATAYGYADGYTQQFYLNGGYKLSESFAFDATYYLGEGDGTNSSFDADLTNVVAYYTLDTLKLSAGFQTVSGESFYEFHWGGDDDNSLQTSNSVQVLDFNRQDEDSWQLRVDYEFSAVPNLKMMVRHTNGEYTDGDEDADEMETNFEVKYTLSGTFLEGMNLRLRYAHIDADNYENIDDFRFIVNYYF